jgi:hypothetical protein
MGLLDLLELNKTKEVPGRRAHRGNKLDARNEQQASSDFQLQILDLIAFCFNRTVDELIRQ